MSSDFKKEALKKDFWDILQIVIPILSPIVIGLLGLMINNTIKQKEIESKYVEIALNTLQIRNDSSSVSQAKTIIKKYAPELLELIQNSTYHRDYNIVLIDTIRVGIWFLDKHSGTNIFIRKIELYGNEKASVFGKIKRGGEVKDFDGYELPNPWHYKDYGISLDIIPSCVQLASLKGKS